MRTVHLERVKAEHKVGATLDHLYCCNEDLSLCGLDISDHEELDNLINPCVMCNVLGYSICDRCGE